MTSLMNNKKGINDITIITGIIIIFVFTALFIPIVQSDLGTTQTGFDATSGLDDARQTTESGLSTVNAFSVFVNVGKLALVDIGNTLGLPFWLDAFYSILAVILILTIARNVWIGGGS